MSVRTWGDARSLKDLGQCVALWLEGRLSGDMEVAPFYLAVPAQARPLVPCLARVNRSGNFVITGFQPGCTPDNQRYEGEHPWQRASVSGFVPHRKLGKVVRALSDFKVRTATSAVAIYADIDIALDGNKNWVYRTGSVEDRQKIAQNTEVLRPALVNELVAAYQVCVVDLQWGRNTLWNALLRLC